MNELMFYNLKQVPGLTGSLASQVSRELGRRIVAGIYAENDLIEDENTLLSRYQVSRSVIRDAVKILVGKGLLEVRRGIGTRVKPRIEWVLLDDDVLAWHQSGPFRIDFFKKLMEIRLIIEPNAARWASERGTNENIRKIELAQKKMEDEKGSIEDFVIADAQFHQSIIRAADNEILESMEGVIFSALLNSIRITNKDPRDNMTSIPFHSAVTNAIVERNPDLAELNMKRLLGDADKRLRKESKENYIICKNLK